MNTRTRNRTWFDTKSNQVLLFISQEKLELRPGLGVIPTFIFCAVLCSEIMRLLTMARMLKWAMLFWGFPRFGFPARRSLPVSADACISSLQCTRHGGRFDRGTYHHSDHGFWGLHHSSGSPCSTQPCTSSGTRRSRGATAWSPWSCVCPILYRLPRG